MAVRRTRGPRKLASRSVTGSGRGASRRPPKSRASRPSRAPRTAAVLAAGAVVAGSGPGPMSPRIGLPLPSLPRAGRSSSRGRGAPARGRAVRSGGARRLPPRRVAARRSRGRSTRSGIDYDPRTHLTLVPSNPAARVPGLTITRDRLPRSTRRRFKSRAQHRLFFARADLRPYAHSRAVRGRYRRLPERLHPPGAGSLR